MKSFHLITESAIKPNRTVANIILSFMLGIFLVGINVPTYKHFQQAKLIGLEVKCPADNWSAACYNSKGVELPVNKIYLKTYYPGVTIKTLASR